MDGYTRLAALIGTQPEYAIFRRYMTLRALQLLHLSARIAQLEDELGIAIDLDRTSGDPEKALYESYYRKLKKSEATAEASQQLKIWSELDAVLKAQGEGKATVIE